MNSSRWHKRRTWCPPLTSLGRLVADNLAAAGSLEQVSGNVGHAEVLARLTNDTARRGARLALVAHHIRDVCRGAAHAHQQRRGCGDKSGANGRR